MLGLGHAILTGEVLVGENPFGVLLADDFCINKPGVLKQMVELYEDHECSIVAIEEVPRDQTNRYGIIDGDEIEPGIFQVSTMVEKPDPADAPSNLAIIGRYILTPSIFGYIRGLTPGAGGEIQITDAINEQARQEKVLAFKFEGRRFDCGSIDGFVDATNHVFRSLNSSP